MGGWVAGKSDDQAPRICQPVTGGAGTLPMPPPTSALRPVGNVPQSAFQPPPVNQFSSASNHYAAAFGGAVVGANNPVALTSPTTQVSSTAPSCRSDVATHGSAASQAAPVTAASAAATEQVDLLNMDEQAAQKVPDLLGDICDAPPSQSSTQLTPDLLDFSEPPSRTRLPQTLSTPT